jgi:fructuronate reductase
MSTLERSPPWVRRPKFEIAKLKPGILHLGCGAFHRAHQAVYTQRAIEAAGGAEPAPWGIVGVSLRSRGLRDVLKPQNGLYTVLERGPEGLAAEIVGTLRGFCFAPEEPARLYAHFRNPDIRIVTLTVTASGYCLDATTGRLSVTHPDVVADLGASEPRSTLGVLVKGLAEVRAAGRRPPVIISCDNLASNGGTLRQALIDSAALRDDALASWIAASVQFPSTMVDRIVPALSELDPVDTDSLVGLTDGATVSTEPFRQWVIEDFEGPRPDWSSAGAEFVGDVAPWEASKLRLLNGTHMAIAYLGLLSGMKTVSAFAQDPVFAEYAKRFMLAEQMPTLPPSGHDIRAYSRELLDRWKNPGIAHQLVRVGRNGSEKLQTRLLASIAENLRSGRPARWTILAVAAWICCVSGAVGRGAAVGVEDPLSRVLARLGADAGGDPDRLVAGFMALNQIFGEDLPRNEAFRTELRDAVAAIQQRGPREAVSALLASA